MTQSEMRALMVELGLDPDEVLDEAVRSHLDCSELIQDSFLDLDSFVTGFLLAAILYSSDDDDGRAYDDPSWSGEPDPLFQPGVFR